MDMLNKPALLLKSIIPLLKGEYMSVIDVGCSGGIDALWRVFEPNLSVRAFDPNLDEIDRLQSLEKNPDVRYVPGFVGIEPDHPFLNLTGGRPFWGRNPWDRLAVAATIHHQAERRKSLTSHELTQINAWDKTRLADLNKPIFLRSYLAENRITSVDFLKIDADGPDFQILNSIGESFDHLGILGIRLEVNWFGSPHPADHTFHNVDRYVRKFGFELYDVTMVRYAHAALPSRYKLNFPAQSESGRPLQGDALYLRDLATEEFHNFSEQLSPQKLLKAVLLFEMAGVPDGAAELFVKFRPKLEKIIDVEAALDTLAEPQSKALFGEKLSYQEFMRRFAVDDPHFYQPPG
jgi:Methyltransferase FkbM domain